jgi:hypothetical protein
MNIYKTLKEKHQEEVNNFPMFFAFNNKQFDEGMKKFGLSSSDKDKIYNLGGGGYYRKTDAKELHGMFERHRKEMKEAMQNENFVYDMFDYELGNHEYNYTQDITDTLDSLGLTYEEVEGNELLLKCLKRAIKNQEERYAENG